MSHEYINAPTINLYAVRLGEEKYNAKTQDQAAQAGVVLARVFENEQPSAILHTGIPITQKAAEIIKRTAHFSSSILEMPEFRDRDMSIYSEMMEMKNQFLDGLEMIQRLSTPHPAILVAQSGTIQMLRYLYHPVLGGSYDIGRSQVPQNGEIIPFHFYTPRRLEAYPY